MNASRSSNRSSTPSRESLDHFQSLAFQIALELIIVAVLLLDLAAVFCRRVRELKPGAHGP